MTGRYEVDNSVVNPWNWGKVNFACWKFMKKEEIAYNVGERELIGRYTPGRTVNERSIKNDGIFVK